MRCGLVFFSTYCAMWLFSTVILVLSVRLAFAASGSVLVESGVFEAGFVVKHTASFFWYGDIAGNGDDDDVASMASERLMAVH